MRITPVLSRDVGEAIEIAARVYPDFDTRRAHAWALDASKSPGIAFLRCGSTFIVASIVEAYFGGPKRCFLLYLFGAPSEKRVWEAVRLLKAVDEWRKENGAESFHFGEDTGLDFAPLAKRLGAKLDKPTWRIDGGHATRGEVSPILSMALQGIGRLSALEQAMRI